MYQFFIPDEKFYRVWLSSQQNDKNIQFLKTKIRNTRVQELNNNMKYDLTI